MGTIAHLAHADHLQNVGRPAEVMLRHGPAPDIRECLACQALLARDSAGAMPAQGFHCNGRSLETSSRTEIRRTSPRNMMCVPNRTSPRSLDLPIHFDCEVR